MMKQMVLENSARRFMPKYFAKVSDEQLVKVKKYIEQFTAHSFNGTKTGDVLCDATSSRGKMIRPRLVLMAAAYGSEELQENERLYQLAAIVEMTHLASLIHDDVVDEAPFRRGKPSIQSKYGKSAAVYAGDFIMSRISYHLMREGLNRAGIVLTKTVEEMCAGEIGQAMCRYRENVTIPEYLQNIHGKTVALFMACCRIGAMEGGCSERIISLLESFGECLGYMFQMRDDLLDFSDNVLIGKSAHQDFKEGIYTLPVLVALQKPGGKEALLPFMKRSAEGTLEPQDIHQMEDVVETLGGMEGAWQQIHAYQRRAEWILQELPDNDVSNQLLKLIRKLGAVS